MAFKGGKPAPEHTSKSKKKRDDTDGRPDTDHRDKRHRSP